MASIDQLRSWGQSGTIPRVFSLPLGKAVMVASKADSFDGRLLRDMSEIAYLAAHLQRLGCRWDWQRGLLYVQQSQKLSIVYENDTYLFVGGSKTPVMDTIAQYQLQGEYLIIFVNTLTRLAKGR